MKALLLSATCLAFLAAGAQSTRRETTREKIDRRLDEYTQRNLLTAQPGDSIDLLDRYSLSGKKPGVYHLPQDNMPCIVPDSTKMVHIPNVWRGSKRVPYRGNAPRIPNLSRRVRPEFLGNTAK